MAEDVASDDQVRLSAVTDDSLRHLVAEKGRDRRDATGGRNDREILRRVDTDLSHVWPLDRSQSRSVVGTDLHDQPAMRHKVVDIFAHERSKVFRHSSRTASEE